MPKSVEKVSQLACGPSHAAAITEDGRVLSWGSAEDGRLGRPKAARAGSNHQRPGFLQDLSDKEVTAVCVSPTHSVARTAKGTLWVWGRVGGTPAGPSLSLPPRS